LSLARPVWLIETGSGPWIVGRDRAWGAPLPVWVCEGCGHADCLAGLDDLAHRTGLDAGQIDPHRPVIDQLTFPCARCGATMRRVAAVIDPAFEEALLPRTTLSQPGAAHLAVGLGDRELGWLGDLAEMAALLEGTLAWEQALALPEDETGTLGEPESVPPADALHWAAYVGRAPADTVRWAAYAGTTPGDAERDVLRPLWRIATDLPGLSPGEEDSGGDAAGTLLERWALACLHQATIAVSEALDATHPGRAVGEVAGLANDLAYWHQVRHLGSGSEGQKVLSCLLAPFAPHLAEAMYRAIGDGAPTSVHLAAWPVPDPAWQDRALLSQVALVRRAAALGQSARQLAGIPAGQPLRQALVASLAPAGPEGDLPIPLLDLLAEMLGAGQARFAGEATEHVVWHLALEPGQAVERDIPRQEIETALANLTPEQAAELAAQLRRGLSISLDAATQAITILPDEVVITAQGRPGWAAAADPGLLVVLHAALDVG
jgi:isoleucyl-tRNA synthetase